jgi:hypothetical protein
LFRDKRGKLLLRGHTLHHYAAAFRARIRHAWW